MQFAIYRSNIHYSDSEEEIADCLECNSTVYTRLLKVEYNEDKGKDFRIIDQRKMNIWNFNLDNYNATSTAR